MEGHKRAGLWTPQESALNITTLELGAVFRALESLEPLIKGKCLHLLCDNTAAVCYICNEGGTRSLSLFRETRDILLWCSPRQVTIRPFFLPGPLNSLADILSRLTQVLCMEWTLHTAAFQSPPAVPGYGCGPVRHPPKPSTATVYKSMPGPSCLVGGCLHVRVGQNVRSSLAEGRFVGSGSSICTQIWCCFE